MSVVCVWCVCMRMCAPSLDARGRVAKDMRASERASKQARRGEERAVCFVCLGIFLRVVCVVCVCARVVANVCV